MPKVVNSQVGQVFLREVAPRKWRASWVDPLTKKHVRRIVPAVEFREAERFAKEINSQLAAGKGFGGRLRGGAGQHTVADAVLMAVQHSNANEQTRKSYLTRYNAFSTYLAGHAKGVQSWADVTPQVLENFLEDCRRQGKAYDTIRQRIFVLRLTSDFMSRTFPESYRDVAGRLRLKRMDAPNLETETAILTPEQTRALLDWLKANEPMVHAWAVLQALCGLRLFEAAYLREQDFNATARTITITESPAHRPKNRPSHRTIPICPMAARVLHEWIDSLKVRHHNGYLFFPPRGLSGRKSAKSQEARAGVFRGDHVSRIWIEALALARSRGTELPEAFIPRKLRGSFVTAMRSAGADFEILQRYIGHSPSSILSQCYDRVGVDRLSSIARLADDLSTGAGCFTQEDQTGLKTIGLLH